MSKTSYSIIATNSTSSCDDTGKIDRYADGVTITSRRKQKAVLLAEIVEELFPDRRDLRAVDFGCADGAVPVLMLNSEIGERIEKVIGISLLDYNDLPEKKAHEHSRFKRLVTDLDEPIDQLNLDPSSFDFVMATSFFHYLRQPEVAFRCAHQLLKPGGCLLAGMLPRWLLGLRRVGYLGVRPCNNRIRQLLTLDGWRDQAESCGFEEMERRPVQWAGADATAGIELFLRRRRLLRRIATNHLVIYRKTEE